MKDEFKFSVYNEPIESVLYDVFTHLRDGNVPQAFDTCAKYYSAVNAQIEVDSAIESYKKYIEAKSAPR